MIYISNRAYKASGLDKRLIKKVNAISLFKYRIAEVEILPLEPQIFSSRNFELAIDQQTQKKFILRDNWRQSKIWYELMKNVHIIGIRYTSAVSLAYMTPIIDYKDGKFQYETEILVTINNKFAVVGEEEAENMFDGSITAKVNLIDEDIIINNRQGEIYLQGLRRSVKTLYKAINARYDFKNDCDNRDDLKRRIRMRRNQWVKYAEKVILGGLKGWRKVNIVEFKKCQAEPYQINDNSTVSCFMAVGRNSIKLWETTSKEEVVVPAWTIRYYNVGERKLITIPKNVYMALKFSPDKLSTSIADIKYYKWAVGELEKILRGKNNA
jgi:hypothetical protein